MYKKEGNFTTVKKKYTHTHTHTHTHTLCLACKDVLEDGGGEKETK